MYEFISESESKRYRNDCSQVLKITCQNLKKKGITAQFTLVGSGARNLVTQNGDAPYDLDYNLEIIKAEDKYLNDLCYLKETVRVSLNEAENNEFFRDAHDSTSVLTTVLHFKDTPEVEFSFDVAITMKNKNGTMCRLIHNKNAWGFGQDQYTWCEVPSAADVMKKAQKIKVANMWINVRNSYLYLKNYYINDRNHPSYVVYVEAVNEIYNTLSNKQAKNPDKEAKKKTVQSPANISDKTKFNNSIQQTLAKSKIYDNKTIGVATKLACKNYSGKLSKESVRKELTKKLGKGKVTDIYNRIANKLK